MKIIWSRRAIRHLAKVRDYIAQDNPDAAADIAAQVLAAVRNLENFPNIGRLGSLPGTRERVVPNTPYIVPYRIHAGRIELIAVFHGRQRWSD